MPDDPSGGGNILRTQRSVCWLVVSLQSFHASPSPPPLPHGGGGGGLLVWNMKPGGGHSEGVHSRGIGDSSNLQYEGTCDEGACLGIEHNGFV